MNNNSLATPADHLSPATAWLEGRARAMSAILFSAPLALHVVFLIPLRLPGLAVFGVGVCWLSAVWVTLSPVALRFRAPTFSVLPCGPRLLRARARYVPPWIGRCAGLVAKEGAEASEKLRFLVWRGISCLESSGGWRPPWAKKSMERKTQQTTENQFGVLLIKRNLAENSVGCIRPAGNPAGLAGRFQAGSGTSLLR